MKRMFLRCLSVVLVLAALFSMVALFAGCDHHYKTNCYCAGGKKEDIEKGLVDGAVLYIYKDLDSPSENSFEYALIFTYKKIRYESKRETSNYSSNQIPTVALYYKKNYSNFCVTLTLENDFGKWGEENSEVRFDLYEEVPFDLGHLYLYRSYCNVPLAF